MKDMILISLKTSSFNLSEGNIHEIAALAVKDEYVIDKLFLESTDDENSIKEFNNFINKYKFPLVSHNASFTKKFLVHFNYIDENYDFFDSIRAIKYSNSKLLSYSMDHLMDYMGIKKSTNSNSFGTVENLFEIIKAFKPNLWIPIGGKGPKSYVCKQSSCAKALKKDFEVVKDLFAGQNIVFTGAGPHSRNKLIELAKKCGAICSSNTLTKKTTMLVVGEKPGSKLEKATERGIEILDMSDFFEMINDIALDEKESQSISKITSSAELDTPIILSDKLKNQVISLIPMKHSLAIKASKLILSHGGIPLLTLRQKETSLLVYEPYGENTETVKRAKSKNIKTMTLGEFNKYIINLESEGF